jgi:hypothetical protein
VRLFTIGKALDGHGHTRASFALSTIPTTNIVQRSLNNCRIYFLALAMLNVQWVFRKLKIIFKVFILYTNEVMCSVMYLLHIIVGHTIMYIQLTSLFTMHANFKLHIFCLTQNTKHTLYVFYNKIFHMSIGAPLIAPPHYLGICDQFQASKLTHFCLQLVGSHL